MSRYKRLVMCKGLPASGKSTWAEQERIRLEGQGSKVMVSTKDDIRKAMSAAGWTWSQEAEKDVIKIQNQQITGAFSHGSDVVIVADCNFGKHEARLRGIAQQCKADFEIKDFTSVPLSDCITRDAARPEAQRVGPEVITNMYKQYIANPNPDKYVPDISKNPAIICDLDGTLALHNGRRSPYDESKVEQDDVNEPIERILRLFDRVGYSIIYVSGRKDSCREATQRWLEKNHLYYGILIMRGATDTRNDALVKLELFNEHIRNNYNVKFVLDDRDRVVKMWRDLGLTCLQVNYGNF